MTSWNKIYTAGKSQLKFFPLLTLPLFKIIINESGFVCLHFEIIIVFSQMNVFVSDFSSSNIHTELRHRFSNIWTSEEGSSVGRHVLSFSHII